MTNGAQRGGAAKYTSTWFEKGAAYVAALIVVGGSLYLIIRNEPFTDQNLVVLARTILSFAMAVLGATVPGFLNLAWKGGGLVVRAGGALALFVLTFTYTPNTYTPNVLPLGTHTEEMPHTDLKIIDVTSESNAVDIKVKNSGNDSAFVKEVRFIQRFAYAGCCGCSYGVVHPTVYGYPLTYEVDKKKSISRLPVHSFDRPEHATNIGLTENTPTNKETRCKGSTQDKNATTKVTISKGVNDSIFEDCLAHYRGYGGKLDNREVETTGIKLSQEVPPRGVDRFQLLFSTPQQQQLASHEYLVLEGYAVIFYDSDEHICTPDFTIVFPTQVKAK